VATRGGGWESKLRAAVFGWFFGWLVGWGFVWLVGCLGFWLLVGFLVVWVFGSLVGWFFVWLVGSCVGINCVRDVASGKRICEKCVPSVGKNPTRLTGFIIISE